MTCRSDSIFDEDSDVAATAERHGLEMIRTQPVTITDLKAIKAAGLVRETPDYPRIKKLLRDGVKVTGADLGPMEYVLREPGVKDGDLGTEA